jgi:hypothetical protein
VSKDKKTKKKLNLAKRPVRALTQEELRGAAGAGTGIRCMVEPTHNNGS